MNKIEVKLNKFFKDYFGKEKLELNCNLKIGDMVKIITPSSVYLSYTKAFLKLWGDTAYIKDVPIKSGLYGNYWKVENLLANENNPSIIMAHIKNFNGINLLILSGGLEVVRECRNRTTEIMMVEQLELGF